MTQEKAREAILQSWLDLAPEQRQTEHQAAVFATKAMQRYKFPVTRGDPFQLIMHWLDPYIPQRAGLQPNLSALDSSG